MRGGNFQKTLKKAVFFFSHQAVPFTVLPAFMLILVAGTVSQRYLGLYDSQKLFFSSFIVWAGPLPLPGGCALVMILLASLLLKFVLFSRWQWNRSGINLAHLGVIILLGGGLFTALSAQEGAMVIPEGGSSASVSDYHRRELVILKDGQAVAAFPHASIKDGAVLDAAGLRLEIVSACRNCAIERRAPGGDETFRDMARFMALKPGRPKPQDEENLYGFTFRLDGARAQDNGTYVAFDIMPKPVHVETPSGAVDIVYRREERMLPFTVRLTDFVRENYPGTDKARHYSSSVRVLDGGMDWPALIEMNSPLRYRGYTLFQASFIGDPDAPQGTVLAVVRNRAWLFPYIGTAIMAAGLLLHFILMLRAGRGTA